MTRIITKRIGTCRHSVQGKPPHQHLVACGKPATSVRILVRRLNIEALFQCDEHTPEEL